MHPNAKFIFTAAMDVDADKEALFNEVYDSEHLPNLLKVPGVVAAYRFAQAPLTMSLAGELKTMTAPGEPKYSAVYEIESAAVLTSAAWGAAGEAGRWPGEVRPFTHNRRLTLRRLM